MQSERAGRGRVVIVGAGFGGLAAARALRGRPVDALVLDRHNYHTFLPLLYEVASAGLEPDDIAQPVRAILRGAPNIRFRMATVERVDLDRRLVVADNGTFSYDYLILAPGSATNFFGVASANRALGLKDLAQATALRNHVLRSFECAATLPPSPERDALMTVVVIGGGPTGVELAGALAELKRHVLPHDYPELDVSRARVILLEATDRLLSAMPRRLQVEAAAQLRDLGVEVRFHAVVADVTGHGVRLKDGEEIASENVVWVAGVRGEALGERLGVELGPGARVPVAPTLQLAGHPEVFVVGDLALLTGPGGTPYPMLAPVAMQQARIAAENILRMERGRPPLPFRYRDRGIMATIGRRKAVAHVFGLSFSGFIAWLLWLFVHLIQLVGLRNRALVLVNWVWNYLRSDRANRLVTDDAPAPSVNASRHGAQAPDDAPR
jgi:NADH dehydrogenase